MNGLTLAIVTVLSTFGATRVDAQRPEAAPNAQAPAAPGEVRVVEGRVRRPDPSSRDSTGTVPVPNVWVVVHRVGRDTAGALDSMRTGPSGLYHLEYRPSGADAIYFASVTYGGIAYFTNPLRAARVAGDDAEITVFDTTSRTFPLSIKGRHLIIGAVDSTNMRTIIEVFEVGNDSSRTLVPTEKGEPVATWSTLLPLSAREVRMNENELPAGSFQSTPGRIRIFAPFAPGLKQLSFTYKIAASNFPVTFYAQKTAVFEVLLEESSGRVDNEHFHSVDPVTLEGRRFRRFLAQDVEDNEKVLVDLPASRSLGRSLYIAGLLVLIGGAMLLVLSRSMARRRSAAPTLRPLMEYPTPDLPLHEQLAREIAALDAVFARHENPTDAVREAYQRRRSELRDALAGALAASPPSR